MAHCCPPSTVRKGKEEMNQKSNKEVYREVRSTALSTGQLLVMHSNKYGLYARRQKESSCPKKTIKKSYLKFATSHAG